MSIRAKKKTARKPPGKRETRAKKKARAKTAKRVAKKKPSGAAALKRLQPDLKAALKHILARRRRRIDALPRTPWLKLVEVELDGYIYTLNRIRPLRTDPLTRRQRQIARLVSQGLFNRQIAAQLRLSPATVAAHLRTIFTKLGVKSRTAVARHALAYYA